MSHKYQVLLAISNDKILKPFQVFEISTFKLLSNNNIFIWNLILENPWSTSSNFFMIISFKLGKYLLSIYIIPWKSIQNYQFIKLFFSYLFKFVASFLIVKWFINFFSNFKIISEFQEHLKKIIAAYKNVKSYWSVSKYKKFILSNSKRLLNP
jgi:hypothetical protein